jgi:hypothetical protein
VTVPVNVRAEVKAELWRLADEMEWDAMSSADKARCYSQWTDSAKIGGKLATYMDPRSVRVYIKDTLLKGYGRHKLNEHKSLLIRLAERNDEDVIEEYIKPHGLRFADGRLVAWGRADDWKAVLMAIFERASEGNTQPSLVALFRAAPRFTSPSARNMVEDAAQRLGVHCCVWFD